MDAREELEQLRRLAELEGKMTRGNALSRGAATLATGAGETVGGLLQLPGILTQALTKNRPDDDSFVGKAFKGTEKAGPVQEFGKTVSDYWTGFNKQHGMDEGLDSSFVKGVGGSLVMPFMGGAATQPARVVGANLISGGVGEATADLARRFAPEGLKAGAGFLGGLVGGGGSAWLLGPKQSLAHADIRRETEGLTPRDWLNAQQTARDFQTAGATTATAAEALPGETRLATLAQNAANSKGGELLGNQLAQRNNDLTQMGNRIPGTLSPDVSIPDATRSATEAAASRMARIRRAAQRPLDLIRRDELSGVIPPIPGNVMDPAYRTFEQLANMPGQAGADTAALKGFLPEFLDENAPTRTVLTPGRSTTANGVRAPALDPTEQQGFQERLSALLLNLAENSKRATGPLATAAQTVPKRAHSAAQRTAFDTVHSLPEPWGPRAQAAGAEYLRRRDAWVTPREGGTLGKVSGNRAEHRGPISEGRLEAILDDPQAGKTAGVMRELGREGADLRAIAAALIRRQNPKGATNFPELIAGNRGSDQENQLMELVQSAGGNPIDMASRLNAGRQMQQLGPSKSIKGMPEMRSGQAFLRPFRTIDMMITGKTMEDTQREIARLLRDPANLPEIQRIAMFDPNVRRALTLQQALLPGLRSITQPEQ